jgi:hypothetical protein
MTQLCECKPDPRRMSFQPHLPLLTPEELTMFKRKRGWGHDENCPMFSTTQQAEYPGWAGGPTGVTGAVDPTSCTLRNGETYAFHLNGRDFWAVVYFNLLTGRLEMIEVPEPRSAAQH